MTIASYQCIHSSWLQNSSTVSHPTQTLCFFGLTRRRGTERASRCNKSAISFFFPSFFCKLTHVRQNQRTCRQVGFRRSILGLSLEGPGRRLASLIYFTSQGCIFLNRALVVYLPIFSIMVYWVLDDVIQEKGPSRDSCHALRESGRVRELPELGLNSASPFR